jgi:hypothetical protein
VKNITHILDESKLVRASGGGKSRVQAQEGLVAVPAGTAGLQQLGLSAFVRISLSTTLLKETFEVQIIPEANRFPDWMLLCVSH